MELTVEQQRALALARARRRRTEAEPSVMGDIARTAPAGVARGVANLAGLPGVVREVGEYVGDQAVSALNFVTGQGYGLTPDQQARAQAAEQSLMASALDAPTPTDITRNLESATGPLYRPQTVPGEFVNTALEFLPSMAIGVGSVPQRLGQALIPAVASEGMGQAARVVAPEYETAARVVGALGGGVGVARYQNPVTPQSMMSGAMRNVDDATVMSARTLMDDAAAQGTPLTWAEAIQRVSGGSAPRLAAIQRVAENTDEGSAILGPMMGARGSQMQSAGAGAVARLADETLRPEVIGIRTQQAAGGAFRELEQARTRLAQGPYLAAVDDVVAPERVQSVARILDDMISRDPTNGALSETARAIRSQLVARAAVPGTPARRVEVRPGFFRFEEGTPPVPEVLRTNAVELDDIYKVLRDAVGDRPSPTATATERMAWAQGRRALTELDNAIKDSSQAIREGRAIYGDVSDRIIKPAAAGPLGAIRDTDIGVEQIAQQSRAIMPTQPFPNSEAGIRETVRRLVRQDPVATQGLIQSGIQRTFDEAMQSLQGTGGRPNPFGGAKFSAVLTGNTQQAKNLEAAVRALPDGDARWSAFRRFLDIAEATGERLAAGSPTSFNQEIQRQMRTGGVGGEIANVAATGGVRGPSRMAQWYEDFRYGRNAADLARLLTDPQQVQLMRTLANGNMAPRTAEAIVLRLIQGGAASNSGSAQAVPPAR